MSRKFSVLELPIYRDYFQIYLDIIEILETKKDTSKHRILIIETYKTIIQIFPNLNAGYNYWGTKGKIKIYNKVRILLSYLQSQLHFLYELKVLEIDYFEEMEGSIRYVGGLIKKMESLPNEK